MNVQFVLALLELPVFDCTLEGPPLQVTATDVVKSSAKAPIPVEQHTNIRKKTFLRRLGIFSFRNNEMRNEDGGDYSRRRQVSSKKPGKKPGYVN